MSISRIDAAAQDFGTQSGFLGDQAQNVQDVVGLKIHVD
jgi:hypothetical protein